MYKNHYESLTKAVVLLLLGGGLSFAQTKITVSDCDIQAAIERCAGRCTVSVPAGTCHLRSAISWAGTGKRINLECAGRSQTILVCPAGVQCINVDSNSRIAHCDLRGSGNQSPYAIINGQKHSGITNDVVIEDNIIEGSPGQGLNSGGGALRWTIRDNLVQNNAGDGIFLASGTSDSIIADNVIKKNRSNGIDCNGSGNSFHGNISNSNGLPGGAIDRNGILISGISNGSSADHNSVVGNETNYNGGSGINIRADFGTTANYNIVSGNVSHDNSGTGNNGDGISIDGSDLGTWIGNVVIGNTVYHNQRYGIEVDGQNSTTIQNTVISSNVSVENGNTGIILGGPRVQDTLIVSNMAMSNQNGQITDLYSSRAVIAGNKEDASDSSYVVKNELIANSFQTPAGPVGPTMANSGIWRSPGGVNIGGDLSNDGSGLKHQSTSTGVLGPKRSAVVAVTWSTPFSDSNYHPQCSIVDTASSVLGLRVNRIQSFSAAGVMVRVTNDNITRAHSGTLYCLWIHQAKASP